MAAVSSIVALSLAAGTLGASIYQTEETKKAGRSQAHENRMAAAQAEGELKEREANEDKIQTRDRQRADQRRRRGLMSSGGFGGSFGGATPATPSATLLGESAGTTKLGA